MFLPNGLRAFLVSGLALLTACADETITPPGNGLLTPASLTAAEMPRTPQPVIETGMHTATIRRIDIDAAGRFLVSGSVDKTIRVWDLASGELLRTIRMPIAPGRHGEIRAVALSPDGQLIAAASRTERSGKAKHIHMFRLSTGEEIARIEIDRTFVDDLAFSDAGHYLAAGLGDRGLRIYETSGFSESARDEGYEGRISRIDFSADGRLATASYDGFIRLYDRAFDLIAKATGRGGKKPFGIAFTPDGRELAVGYEDTTAVEIYAASDLVLLHQADINDANYGDLGSLAWSTDGERLCAGGRYNVGGEYPVRCWRDRGRGRAEDSFTGAKNTIQDMMALQDSGFLVGTSDPGLTRVDASGGVTWSRRGETMDPRGQLYRNSMQVSSWGDVVRFGFEKNGGRPIQFDLGEGRLSLDPAPDPILIGARIDAPGLTVANWEDNRHPILNGEPIILDDYEMSRSLAIAPDGERFVLGTEWKLRAYDRDGGELWRQDVTGTAWSVTISGDGRTVIAVLGDGTIRWFDLDDGRELLALFPHVDGERWVAWTPEGFFAASETGAELMGYHLNRAPGEAPDFVRTEQLFDYFYRPDLLVHRLERDETPIREALAEIGDIDQLLVAGRPPALEMIGGSAVESGRRSFLHEVVAEDQGGGVGRIEYRVNGVVVKTVDSRTKQRVLGEGRVSYLQPFELGQGRNRIETRIWTRDNKVASPPSIREVVVDDPLARPPALYGLAVGIDAYYDGDLGLNYAAADALRVKQLLEAQGQGLFTKTDIKLLTDEAATKAEIGQAFRDLAAVVQPNDVFVLYLSGHGIATDGRYHFIPQDLAYSNDEAFKEQSLGEADLTALLATITAQKSLVILDTCYAGAFGEDGTDLAFAVRGGVEEKTAIDRLMRATGRAVLAASTDRDLALEGYEGHGLYTYALLEALGGVADARHGDGNGAVNINEISSYLNIRVPELSFEAFGRRQIPMFKLTGQPFSVTLAQ